MKLHNMVIAGLLFNTVNIMAAPTQDQIDFAYDEAAKRISPVTVVMDVDYNVRNCGFSADGTTEYTVTWKVKSYEPDVRTLMSIHDCKGLESFTCGETYNTKRIYASPVLSAVGQPNPDWEYTASNGVIVPSYEHTFSTKFKMPTQHKDTTAWSSEIPAINPPNPDGGDQIVFRWWQKTGSAPDRANSVTLLLGTEAGYHYGNNSRRIQSNVSYDLNVLSETCEIVPE